MSLPKTTCAAVLFFSSVLMTGCGGDSNPVSSSTAISGDIRVSPDGGGGFASIQAAIDAAAPGAVITVEPGVYRGYLLIDKPVTVRGGGEGVIVRSPLDASRSSGSALLVIRGESDRVVEDMTFEGGDSEGVLIRNSSDVTLRNVTASGNGGHGVDIRESCYVSIVDCTFENNGHNGVRVRDWSHHVEIKDGTASGNGDNGVRVRESEGVTVGNMNLSGNHENGARVRESKGVVLTGNTIAENGEWGLRLREADVTESENTFSDNHHGPVRIDD